MRKNFRLRLSSGRVMLSDGALGTELQKRGLGPGAPPEMLNLHNPAIVSGVHKAYADAGSELITTNTFGANRFRLALHGLESRVSELCFAAVALARQAAPECFIAGSVGPTGTIVAPLGETSQEEVFSAYFEQARALRDAGADLILIETMMDPVETAIAIRASNEASELPVIASMTFELGKAGLRTMWGTSVPEAAQAMLTAGADVIGANCGRGFEEIVLLAAEFRAATDARLVFQSNAGMPVMTDSGYEYRQTPQSLEQYIPPLLAQAPAIIGGCCGTTPLHIAKIKELIELLVK